MEQLFRLKSKLDKNGVFLSFNGPISQDLMVELGDVLKKQMEMAEADMSTILKVFSALVEQSQNIIRHSAEVVPPQGDNEQKLMFGTIAVGFKEGKYFVMGGNKIRKSDEITLKSRLKQIQDLEKDGLKKLYHQHRKQNVSADSSNKGLGLIELARKATEPIQFDFIPIDDHFTFFSIRTFI